MNLREFWEEPEKALAFLGTPSSLSGRVRAQDSFDFWKETYLRRLDKEWAQSRHNSTKNNLTKEGFVSEEDYWQFLLECAEALGFEEGSTADRIEAARKYIKALHGVDNENPPNEKPHWIDPP